VEDRYTAIVLTPLTVSTSEIKDDPDSRLAKARSRGSPKAARPCATVSISESQRTMPSDAALKTAMTAAVCQKLAATLLNGLTESLSGPR
jgi:hypothetical protein